MKSIFVVFFFMLIASLNVTSQVSSNDTNDIIYNSYIGDDENFLYVDVMPKFPGGDEALNNFLRNNIQYPSITKEMGVQGKVFASFIVEKDGTVSNQQIVKGFNDDCNKEVIRVLKMMPKWQPGSLKEKAVRVRFNLPVSFVIQ